MTIFWHESVYRLKKGEEPHADVFMPVVIWCTTCGKRKALDDSNWLQQDTSAFCPACLILR